MMLIESLIRRFDDGATLRCEMARKNMYIKVRDDTFASFVIFLIFMQDSSA